MRPLTDSRSLRVFVDRGSMEYSAVTHPLPLPVIQRGTPPVKLAVQSTFVRPNEISALPSACALQPRSMVTSRSWSAVRPSARTFVGSVMSLLWCGGGRPRDARPGGWMREMDGAGLDEFDTRDLG